MKNKKGLTGIISVILILLVTVVLATNYNSWYYRFLDNKIEDLNTVSKGDIEVVYLDGDKLYLRNHARTTISFENLIIEGTSCNISGTLLASDLTSIDLDACTKNMEIGVKDVQIFSNENAIFQERVLLKSTFVYGISVLFEPSNVCPDIFYKKIYAMNALNNSHAELGSQSSYTYSLCIKSEEFDLGTSCSGTHSKVFSLAGVTNSPIYINESNAAVEPYADYYDWQDVCISAYDADDITITINPIQPVGNYSCIGSLIQDDFNGGVIGDCSRYSDKIWLHIE